MGTLKPTTRADVIFAQAKAVQHTRSLRSAQRQAKVDALTEHFMKERGIKSAFTARAWAEAEVDGDD